MPTDVVDIEAEGVLSANTRTERMGGTECGNAQAYTQNQDVLFDPRVDTVQTNKWRLTNLNL